MLPADPDKRPLKRPDRNEQMIEMSPASRTINEVKSRLPNAKDWDIASSKDRRDPDSGCVAGSSVKVRFSAPRKARSLAHLDACDGERRSGVTAQEAAIRDCAPRRITIISLMLRVVRTALG